MRLALFEPDIPQNTGTLMRLCACLGVPLDIIEPCGFILSDKKLKRAGMDYIDHLALTKHTGWDAFKTATEGQRLVLLSTKAADSFLDFKFRPDDVLLAGRESGAKAPGFDLAAGRGGVPDHVHAYCAAKVLVPMAKGLRSLNVALASALVLGEALRQTGGYPP